ncbi:MAG TPA: phenylalanine--tRNA ligase subunit beta [Myxococcota bacterium]|nr:phenylalanine--tRNA ligase subunit beta [Myxococcota bacterium]
MRVPLGWLAEWTSVRPPAAALAERLTLAGLAVDSIERVGPDLSGVRVGLVRERSPHPAADRLSVCQVELAAPGDDAASVEIVCGAPNVAAGQKVAVALPGTRLPDGSVLKRSKIRGVVSNGMICSARELALGGEHEGILVLDPNAPVGAPLASVMPVGDTVFELELTPNRGDCASILGVAREVRALFGGELRVPPCTPKEDGPPASAQVRVEVVDTSGCPQYIARVVRGVRVGLSPDWLRRRLESIGVRSISNVVDVTNLVLHELGQPLHAFDLSTLRGGIVRVRSASAGERLVTLDGETRELSPEDLVIADAERAIALAGIMGGAGTEVSATTTDLLIESAQFAPTRIRRSARRTGIHSEAAYRFERGVDPQGVRRAADRAALLLAEVAGGQVSSGAVEVQAAGAQSAPREIVLDPARVNRLLGTPLGTDAIRELLERLEIAVRCRDAGLVCVPPSYRNDLALPEDLVEEVARMHGYERIPATLPEGPVRPVTASRARLLRQRAADALVGAGLVETMTLAFMNPGDLDRLDLSLDDPRRRTVRVLNPVSEEDSRLRSTLLPSLLRTTRQNLARRVERVQLFEISRVFLAGGLGDGSPAELPDEPLRLLAVVTRGERASLWEPHEPAPLFFEAKGLAERLLRALGYTAWFRSGTSEPYLHPGAASDIGVGETVVGCVGELHPEVSAGFEIELPCAVCELDLRALAELVPESAQFHEVSNQPPVRRDIAVLLDCDRPAGDILEAIRKTAGPHLVSADLFDRYEGRGIPEGKVSLAFRLIFQRPDRAFTDEEIVRMTDRVVQMLAHRFGGELR